MDGVPRGVLSMLSPALNTTGRMSFPGGGQGLANSKLPVPAEGEAEADAKSFLPVLAHSTSQRNRGASMPGYGLQPLLKHGQPGSLGGISENKASPLGPGRDVSPGPRPRADGVFTPAGAKGQTTLPEKGAMTAFPDPDEFRSPWPGMPDQTKSAKPPPWLKEILARLDRLEGRTSPSPTDPGAPGKLHALEEGLKQVQQQQQVFQQHEKVLLKKLTLVQDQLAALEAKVQTNSAGSSGGLKEERSEGKLDAKGAGKGGAGPKGVAAGGKADTELKASLADHDKKLKEHQKQLQEMAAALAKLQQGGADGGKQRKSDTGGKAPAAAAPAGKVAADPELLQRLDELESKQGAMDTAVVAATANAAAALEAANKAETSAAAAAAASGAASSVVSKEVQQAIEAVVSPLMQQTASEVAALSVRVQESDQSAERALAQLKELQAAMEKLQGQATPRSGSGGSGDTPPEGASKASAGVEAQILLAMGAKVDKVSDNLSKLSKRVDALESSSPPPPMVVPDVTASPARRHSSTLMTIEEAPSSQAPPRASASVSGSLADDVRSASQISNQAMGASSKALTQAAQALALANSSAADMAALQAASKQQQEGMMRLEQMATEAARLASVAHHNVTSIEQVAKTLAVKIDTITMEVIQIKAKQDCTPTLSAAQAQAVSASMAAAPGGDGGSGSDPRVGAILVDLQQLATGLGELAGRISVTEREFKMALPTLARAHALKELEGTLMDKQAQLTQEIEALKRGGAGGVAQSMAWPAAAAAAAAAGSVSASTSISFAGAVNPAAMTGAMPMGMAGMMGMQPGMMQPGMMQPGMMQPGMPGAQQPGRGLAKSNSVLKRSESKRVPSNLPANMRL